jgi:hypothetical protein
MTDADFRALLAALDRVANVLEEIKRKIPPMEGGLGPRDFPETKR